MKYVIAGVVLIIIICVFWIIKTIRRKHIVVHVDPPDMPGFSLFYDHNPTREEIDRDTAEFIKSVSSPEAIARRRALAEKLREKEERLDP